MAHVVYVDADRCVGCEACAVACMDQNDFEVGPNKQAWRTVSQVETGAFPAVEVAFVTLACLHCGDAPCALACPSGAISRNPISGAVEVDITLCVGCRSCAVACPFGIPRYRDDGTMEKCDLCSTRVEQGLEPACVRVCPAKALRFAPVDQAAAAKEAQSNEAQAVVRPARTTRVGRDQR